MTNTATTATETLTVTCDMSADLGYSCTGPIYTESYAQAREADDFDTMDRLDAEQDALVEAAGKAWEVAAVRIGNAMGYEVEAIDTRDGSVLDFGTRTYVDHRGRLVDAEDADGTIEQTIWQAALDAIGISVDEAGVWTVSTI